MPAPSKNKHPVGCLFFVLHGGIGRSAATRARIFPHGCRCPLRRAQIRYEKSRIVALARADRKNPSAFQNASLFYGFSTGIEKIRFNSQAFFYYGFAFSVIYKAQCKPFTRFSTADLLVPEENLCLCCQLPVPAIPARSVPLSPIPELAEVANGMTVCL